MRIYFLTILVGLLLINCRDFLNEKTNVKLAVPETVEDNQALLENERFINSLFPISSETSADDIYLTDNEFAALPFTELQRLYTWQPDNVMVPIAQSNNDWFNTYRAIYLSNLVLYNIETYNLKGKDADILKGQALSLRALRYLTAVQIWCLTYNKSTSHKDLGLPLRLDPDMNYPSTRATLEETYKQILKDLHEAVTLLPEKGLGQTRMSKPAALGLLARTYLFMADYENALKFALETLKYENTLLNFNTLASQNNFPIPDTNVEILFRSLFTDRHLKNPKVPLELYNLYNSNDLRKVVYFKKESTGEVSFKGHYGNSLGGIAGPVTDEMYLIVAESYARLNNVGEAMNWLNKLLITRWKNGTFVSYSALNSEDALTKILEERRKELIMRGLRWADIKRFNRDGASIILQRTVNNEKFIMQPNDLRFAIAIPEEIITLSGMEQNPR